MISVVIPAYNEERMIERTAKEICRVMKENEIDFEILFVNDGSRDGTWEEIQRLSADAENIRGIDFSRNFGKEGAIFAGLEYSHGDCVVCIDCDLQHPPEKIVEMYRLWQQGFKVVEASCIL